MAVADSQQVAGYLKTYGIVLVTNLRSFVIVDRGPDGRPTPREAFHLVANEQEFWRQKAAHPRIAADERGPQFLEFIKRACLHAAPLAKPKDLAWFVASYARDALARVERQKELPALQSVRAALEEALGMKFTDEKGEHFFRSTLVQTLFYGVFSAWVRWHRDHPGTGTFTNTGGSQTALKFDRQKAEWSLHVPFIRVLYEEVAKPSRLGPLGLVELLDWTAAALNRVSRGEFFQSFEDEHAVQYFYEPFLEAYDPDLRKELGVWYTPREIVKYQVARVDTVLREELGLARGLADENVVVLDPCCGTGAYLVEVLRSIAATLRDEGGDALVANDLKKAAINRVFGFEIMPAPFVVAHLQLGLTLQSAGVPLAESERVGVYLTNALTGWEPPKGVKQHLLWTELEEERDAADHVKRDRPRAASKRAPTTMPSGRRWPPKRPRETSVNELRGLLGATTCDVFLNDRAYWRNVPINVWEYTIGGYQVMKKVPFRQRCAGRLFLRGRPGRHAAGGSGGRIAEAQQARQRPGTRFENGSIASARYWLTAGCCR
jgi:hypothetical protein